MNIQIRVLLAYAALAVYAGLVAVKAFRGRQSLQAPELKVFRFDLIRLTTDCIVLLCFLLSGLCPAWFGLFDDTALGYSIGCFILITGTLIISVLVDWLPFRESCRRSGIRVPAFSVFVLRQLVRIIQICFVLAAVCGVFLLLNPAEADWYMKLAGSVLVILLLLGVLRLVRRSRDRAKFE